jgi:hypothetical protein
MITTAKANNYKNSAFIGFLNDTVAIAEKYNVATLKLTTEVAQIKTSILALNNVYAIAKKNENTETLENLDGARDFALIGIKGLADAYLKHYDPLFVNAAKGIINTFEKYSKRIDKLTYLSETEAIRSLVDDLETDTNLIAHATKLNITDWIQELKTTNTQFNTIYLGRNKEFAEQPDQNLKDLRTPAMEQYSKFVNLVNANNIITPNIDYQKILKEMDELVLKYNATVPKTIKPKTPPQV